MPSTTRCAVLSKNVISQGSQRFFCQMFPLKKKLAAVFHQCRFQTSCSLQTAQHCLRPGTTFKTAVCSALYSLTYKRQCFSFTHRCFASASKRLGVSKPPAAVCGGSDAKACSVAQVSASNVKPGGIFLLWLCFRFTTKVKITKLFGRRTRLNLEKH